MKTICLNFILDVCFDDRKLNYRTGLRSIASGFIKAYTAQFSLYSCKFCSVIEFVPLMNMKVHVLTMYMDVHAPPAVAGCAVLSLERPSCRIV